MAEYIEREALKREFEDVPPALWTDEPISGTEFMTHNQGQSGFEIHFRTDDKAKYDAVQDECRRQIDHAKHAADVLSVVHGRWVWAETGDEDYEQFWICSVCGEKSYWQSNYCPDCGAKMDGGAK